MEDITAFVAQVNKALELLLDDVIGNERLKYGAWVSEAVGIEWLADDQLRIAFEGGHGIKITLKVE